MDHISQHLPKMQGTELTVKAQEHTNCLTVSSKISQLTDHENRVVELKYKSLPFGKMTESDLVKNAKALLLKIHVITGWALPTNEMLGILMDQFTKKIIESFDEINPDEVEYAFRNGGTVVEDWGKEMNLNLIDKILIPYLKNRFQISQIEEKIKFTPPEQKIFSEEENLNAQRAAAESQYQLFRQGIPLKGTEYTKMILEQDELLHEDETVIEFFKRRYKNGSEKIYEKK